MNKLFIARGCGFALHTNAKSSFLLTPQMAFFTFSSIFKFISSDSFINKSVRFIKFMSMLAMCFRCRCASQIFVYSNRFKMIWINTKSIFTKMINCKIFSNGSFIDLIRHSVRWRWSVLIRHISIFFITIAGPNPTGINLLRIIGKPFFYIHQAGIQHLYPEINR